MRVDVAFTPAEAVSAPVGVVVVVPRATSTIRTYDPPGIEEDIAFCAQEDVLDVVPRYLGMPGQAAEITS